MIGSGCDAPQRASSQTVAAYEVPLLTPPDRLEFLNLVSSEANAEGLHVDFASDSELERTADVIPKAKQTMKAAVWRGIEDDQCEAVIMDGYDHLGLVWIMFLQGQDTALAVRFREKVMSKIMARWPETTSLPVTPSGSIPLHRDLIKTPSGYKLDPANTSRYGVDASSPLVAKPQDYR
jgi:hypothetical protein